MTTTRLNLSNKRRVLLKWAVQHLRRAKRSEQIPHETKPNGEAICKIAAQTTHLLGLKYVCIKKNKRENNGILLHIVFYVQVTEARKQKKNWICQKSWWKLNDCESLMIHFLPWKAANTRQKAVLVLVAMLQCPQYPDIPRFFSNIVVYMLH